MFVKIIAIILFLTYLNNPNSPEGVWIYKQDSSMIEINKINGKISGTLISTKNPNRTVGTILLKDFIYCEGHWQGKLYLSSKERWVEAKLLHRENLIIIELDLGYKIKKDLWYKVKI